MAERVIIHVGCPKTGTSWIQHQLVVNRDALAAQGFFYPEDADGFEQHFTATQDLRGVPTTQPGPAGPGPWDQLAQQVRAMSGTAIVSHELLASCTPEQIQRATRSFGQASVEVVITARDLARQIPSEWQEHLKHGHGMTLADFISGIRDPERPEDFARWFWAVQDLPHVAMRWATGVGAANVTVVTVPPAGTAGTVLEERFGEAIGLDVSGLDWEESRRNPSIGVAEAELLRRLNDRCRPHISTETYHDLIRERLVRDVLGPQRVSAPLRMPVADAEWVQEVTDYWLQEIPAAGYRVVGDLQDLVPVLDGDPTDEAVSDGQLAEAATRALDEAIRAFDEIRVEVKELRASLETMSVEHMKRDVVGLLERSAPGQKVLAAWRSRPQR